jgi:subtilisin family serine protease
MLGQGHILVAAAGNGGPGAPPVYPAAYPGVIAVTALDGRLKPFRRANRGDYVQFAAPGVDLVVADTRGRQNRQSGTSLAAPFVTAFLAAEAEQGTDGSTTPLDALRAKARDLGMPGRDPVFGWGLVQAPTICR